MNTLFKVLLAIYAFFLALVSAVVMLIYFENRILKNIYEYVIDNVLISQSASLVMFFIALLFFILSIVFLLSGFKSSNVIKGVSRKTEIGEVRISLESIESIALSATKRVKGIANTKASVTMLEDKVTINVKVEILPDVNIPLATEEMQKEVKNLVESISGITVSEVKVIVDNISKSDVYKQKSEQ